MLIMMIKYNYVEGCDCFPFVDCSHTVVTVCLQPSVYLSTWTRPWTPATTSTSSRVATSWALHRSNRTRSVTVFTFIPSIVIVVSYLNIADTPQTYKELRIIHWGSCPVCIFKNSFLLGINIQIYFRLCFH